MIKVAVVGLGKMGISHQSILGAHPLVDLVGVCDANSYVLGVLGKYTGVETYTDLDTMLERARPDALVVATPSKLHAPMVAAALRRNVHVFCEKPFTLDSGEGAALAAEAEAKGLVTQVGYHNRFVGAFSEVKRLLDLGAIGQVTHVLAEAYGPVVLRPQGGTWRSRSSEGGGCLYDYAAHPLNLVNWYLGEPTGVGGTVLNSIFSAEIDDEVTSTLYYPNGVTAQMSVNWSDESVRKMTTRLTLWGTQGRIFADRQECQVYLRTEAPPIDGYRTGWNVKYTTELTPPVDFYLRGEEYSAELDHFVRRVADRAGGACATAGTLPVPPANDFASSVLTDRCIEAMIRDASGGARTPLAGGADRDLVVPVSRPPRRRPLPVRLLSRALARSGRRNR